jgi:hypothetical protein
MLRIKSSIYLTGQVNHKFQNPMTKTFTRLCRIVVKKVKPRDNAICTYVGDHRIWNFEFRSLRFVCYLVLVICKLYTPPTGVTCFV